MLKSHIIVTLGIGGGLCMQAPANKTLPGHLASDVEALVLKECTDDCGRINSDMRFPYIWLVGRSHANRTNQAVTEP
jgi:hypothetical protein